QRGWELKNQETAFILSVSCLLLPTPNSTSERRRCERDAERESGNGCGGLKEFGHTK
ncbi:unnamed protein product, partial [Pleuronectes platessa]